MTKDEEYINEMTNEIVHYYARLQGVHPVKVEIQYIRKAQQLSDYGHDYFQVKVIMVVILCKELMFNLDLTNFDLKWIAWKDLLVDYSFVFIVTFAY